MKLLLEAENLIGLNYLLEERHLQGRVDLVYIDPPFATNGNFVIANGRISTISQPKNGTIAYTDKILGNEFVDYIKQRLILVRALLSEQGSIYLHTDYKIGHYLKVMMDEVFGMDNFRNDITRIKCNPKNFKRIGYGNIKDMILFYTKTATPIWHEPKEYTEGDDILKLFPKQDSLGRRYTTVPIHAPGETINAKPFCGLMPPPGRHWRTDVATLERWNEEGLIEWSSSGNPRKKIFADEYEGKRVQDVWLDYKDPQYPVYPTEKNQAMIDRIIRTSSNENSIVLDCFCGSGTTLKSANDAGRQWIGIDQSPVAIATTQKKIGIENTLFMDCSYEYIKIDK